MHYIFKLFSSHLAMGILDDGGGDCLPENHGHLFQVFDSIMEIEYLASPFQLSVYCRYYSIKVVLFDFCSNRKSFSWSCSQKGHIPYLQQGHIECSWNRSGREGKTIYICLHLLYLLFVLYAETLLFINYQKAEVFECYIL